MSNRTLAQVRREPVFQHRGRGTAGVPPGAMSAAAPASKPSEPQARRVDRLKHYLSRPILRVGPILFAVGVLAALYAGWSNRHEGHITPENGLGYWLGIAGGTMMLLLLLYPFRKRSKLLRHLGRVPNWFRLHMVLGVLGPALILFHCNFSFGALNSTVALATMLIVVFSGIAGRYLYAKVHNGLYGSKSQVAEILGDAEQLKAVLGGGLPEAEGIFEQLRAFEQTALAPKRGVLSSFAAFLWCGVRARRCHGRLLRQVDGILTAQARRHTWSRREKRVRAKFMRRELALYFAAVKKAARFAIYERLLALWHVLHFPLFLLLVATAVVHVVAVHLY